MVIQGRVGSPLLCWACALAVPVGIIQRIQFRNGTHECSIPTAKAGKRLYPDLVTHDDPRLPHENPSLRRFPSWKVGSADDAFAGLLRAFWLEDKGHWTSRSVTRAEFFGWSSERLTRRSPFTVVVTSKTGAHSNRGFGSALGAPAVRLANRFLLAVPPL